MKIQNSHATGFPGYCLMVLLVAVCSPSAVADQPAEMAGGAHFTPANIYRSPEERREAGTRYQITDWLKIAGLLEFEREEIDFNFSDSTATVADKNNVYSAQLVFELELSDYARAEIVVESEKDQRSTTVLDEAALVLEFDSLEFEIGKLSLPFGEYYSHFISGPMLEFSETKVAALVVNFQINDMLELSTFVFDSQINRLMGGGDVDWGGRIEMLNQQENIKLGIGYLSDLAESDEGFLGDFFNQYSKRVPAFNVYALFGFDNFEITAEYNTALDNFSEFDTLNDRPEAANLEFSWFVNNTVQLSFRHEYSRELQDNPQTRSGIGLNWLATKRLQLSLEYLRSDYKTGSPVDDEEDQPDSQITSDDIVAARLSYQF